MLQSETYLLVIGVPPEYEAAILEAIAQGGAGVVGDYTHCAFVWRGEGHFRPGPNAKPAVGEVSTDNAIPEIRIETTVTHDRLKGAIAAIKAAHPYEEPVIFIIPILDWRAVLES